ncbi:MAG TPA: translation elongation factor Ts [Chitinophagales bacterium]|nr:translation elongation factor Ts [Chitinophagales bacterium]
MVEIKAADVNKLRQQTGAGLMDCKKALVESGGDFEKAIDYLRKKGQKVSALRSDREAKEGVVIAMSNDGMTQGVILNLSCETDFVAKNEEFMAFAKAAARLALDNGIESAEQISNLPYEGITIGEKVTEMVGKIGEKIEIRRIERLEGECVVPYIHSNYKLGVLVAFNQPASDAVSAIGKDLAMQVAAMNPVSVDQTTVPQSVVDRELDIAREKAKADGKPEAMIDKIAAGALQKYFKENTLLSQEFVKDNKKTVTEVLRGIDKELRVTAFKRVSLSN